MQNLAGRIPSKMRTELTHKTKCRSAIRDILMSCGTERSVALKHEESEDPTLSQTRRVKENKPEYFSLVSPLDPNPDPKYKPYLHMKNHHVIDL